MNHSRSPAREAIIAAAVRVAMRDGIFAMTLDAVAREAGLSKGGILYHFAGKESLISGMIEHFLHRVEAEIDRCMAEDPEPQGRFLRAYLRISLAEPGSLPLDEVTGMRLSDIGSLFFSMLAALANNPLLTRLIRSFSERFMTRVQADMGDPVDEMILMLAADGLWFWQILGALSPRDVQIQPVVQSLLQRAQPGGTLKRPVRKEA